MSFFQNVFTYDFEGNWVLGDRQHIPKFVVRRNAGRGDEMVVAWNQGPYDLSGTDADGTNTCDTLEIVFSLHDFKNWATISVDIASGADDTSAVTSSEVVTALNANTLFAERFVASLSGWTEDASGVKRVMIRQRKPATEMRFYINNGRAEEKIQFNGRAGVAELPTYFARHTIANRFSFDDCQNHLIALDPTSSTVEENIIINAVDFKGVSMGYDGTTVQEDWQLLEGRSGLFDFTSNDGSGTVIVYPAGAQEGDLAKKIITDSGNTFVIPYTLTSGDLITPP
jgi:hypothetical protein